MAAMIVLFFFGFVLYDLTRGNDGEDEFPDKD